MSTTFFISDLHFHHKSILNFANKQGMGQLRSGDDYIENMHNMVKKWNNTVGKRDTVWVLGDVMWRTADKTELNIFDELNGTKKLVRGNHDNFDTQDYLKYFKTVEGLVKYKGFWLSHAPIHPNELWGKPSVHGHCHHNSIKNAYTGEYDERYINVCCEAIDETPIAFDLIKAPEGGTLKDSWYYKNRKC